MILRRACSAILAASVLAWSAPARADEGPGLAGAGAPAHTPPRLSYTHGQVSYWRPGAPDWVGAPLNVPLAPGDELFTGPDGGLELQVGPRAWVRAWAATAMGLVSQEPDYLQIKVTSGHAALDVRALEPGHTLELATPGASITIERPGYYRVGVTPERTSLVVRRGGSALALPAGGQPTPVGASQELVVAGADSSAVSLGAAPELDPWDRWNYARTDALAEPASARYVAPDVYGAADLDRHGTWQVVETYGAVWMPRGVPGGWAPYTTGTWIQDPFYGWTWVDAAPWGWAPYHYGRWVRVRGGWGWAPGPVVVRPVYAPALVAFFSGRPSVAVSIGGPVIGWCALGWGEPVVPWWGRRGFAGVPWWGGWGGPRVVNHVVVHHTTVVHAKQITAYSHARTADALVAVRHDDFGGRPVRDRRVRLDDVRHVEPALPAVASTPASLVPGIKGPAQHRPARDVVERPVVVRRGDNRGDNRRSAIAPAGPADSPASRRDAPAPRDERPGRPDEPGRGQARPGDRQPARPDVGPPVPGAAPGQMDPREPRRGQGDPRPPATVAPAPSVTDGPGRGQDPSRPNQQQRRAEPAPPTAVPPPHPAATPGPAAPAPRAVDPRPAPPAAGSAPGSQRQPRTTAPPAPGADPGARSPRATPPPAAQPSPPDPRVGGVPVPPAAGRDQSGRGADRQRVEPAPAPAPPRAPAGPGPAPQPRVDGPPQPARPDAAREPRSQRSAPAAEPQPATGRPTSRAMPIPPGAQRIESREPSVAPRPAPAPAIARPEPPEPQRRAVEPRRAPAPSQARPEARPAPSLTPAPRPPTPAAQPGPPARTAQPDVRRAPAEVRAPEPRPRPTPPQVRAPEPRPQAAPPRPGPNRAGQADPGEARDRGRNNR